MMAAVCVSIAASHGCGSADLVEPQPPANTIASNTTAVPSKSAYGEVENDYVGTGKRLRSSVTRSWWPPSLGFARNSRTTH